MTAPIHIGNLPAKWRSLASAAQNEGAVAIGAAPAGMIPEAIFEQYIKWVHSTARGDMEYLCLHSEARQNPAHFSLFKDAAVVLSCAFPYGDGAIRGGIWDFVSAYARGRDYHKTLKKKLASLTSAIAEIFPGARCRICVDSAPVMERSWAVLAGIGTIGKNGMLIVPGIGPRVLLGEVLVAEVPPILPVEMDRLIPPFHLCGGCSKCLSACPTRALLSTGKMDAGRCLSYISIERRSALSDTVLLEAMELVFGCDRCVAICPLNTNVASALEIPNVTGLPDSLETLAAMETTQLQTLLAGTCLSRTGAIRLQENARVVLANRKKAILSEGK